MRNFPGFNFNSLDTALKEIITFKGDMRGTNLYSQIENSLI